MKSVINGSFCAGRICSVGSASEGASTASALYAWNLTYATLNLGNG